MKENNRSIGPFKDGDLTEIEYRGLMSKISKEEDYLTKTEHQTLTKLSDSEGLVALTKYQFVQCHEANIFRATGVTRG